MNELTARLLRYYQDMATKRRQRRAEETNQPITINNYVFPNLDGIQGIKEYHGAVIYKQRHTRIRHKYKIKYVP